MPREVFEGSARTHQIAVWVGIGLALILLYSSR